MFGSSESDPEIKIKYDRTSALNLKDIQQLLLWLYGRGKKPRYIGIYGRKNLRSTNLIFIHQENNGKIENREDEKDENDENDEKVCNEDSVDTKKETDRKANNLANLKSNYEFKKGDGNLEYLKEQCGFKVCGRIVENYNLEVLKSYIFRMSRSMIRFELERRNKMEQNSKLGSKIDETHIKDIWNIPADKDLKSDKYVQYDKFKDITNVKLEILTKENVEHLLIKKHESVYQESNEFINSTADFSQDYRTFNKLTNKESKHFLVAIDCEMMKAGEQTILGRVSLVDHQKKVLYDKFIVPEIEITDYCTEFSGPTESLFLDKEKVVSFQQMQDDLSIILGRDTIILGHSLFNDLNILKLYHTRLIDTSFLYRTKDNHRVKLSTLARKNLGIVIQDGVDCSVEDARACVDLLALKVEENVDHRTGKYMIDLGVDVKYYQGMNEYTAAYNSKGVNVYSCDLAEFEKAKVKIIYRGGFHIVFYEYKNKLQFIM